MGEPWKHTKSKISTCCRNMTRTDTCEAERFLLIPDWSGVYVWWWEDLWWVQGFYLDNEEATVGLWLLCHNLWMHETWWAVYFKFITLKVCGLSSKAVYNKVAQGTLYRLNLILFICCIILTCYVPLVGWYSVYSLGWPWYFHQSSCFIGNIILYEKGIKYCASFHNEI